ncbi:hypothetical protein [Salmonella enterica]|uniref:hypothetical protein n=1 Tax=Salmonella enterica TaxID=28901 RepID=UPI00198F0020|nr:hypothetical protein [Salmonella enterica]EEJ8616644.1 hypothetical protein [Salmonella enterica subsp. enterica serovar Veneziana]MDQ7464269.1 hypothetical protein [Salmonella enterica subsp. enterica serovar Agona]HAK0845863.1 hypothetical protein [Salmonella enterica]
MKATRQKGAVMKMADCPIVFYLPQASLPLSVYAAQTGQTERAVQQQANNQKIVLMKEQSGKERRVNMVYELLAAYEEAQEALRLKIK